MTRRFMMATLAWVVLVLFVWFLVSARGQAQEVSEASESSSDVIQVESFQLWDVVQLDDGCILRHWLINKGQRVGALMILPIPEDRKLVLALHMKPNIMTRPVGKAQLSIDAFQIPIQMVAGEVTQEHEQVMGLIGDIRGFADNFAYGTRFTLRLADGDKINLSLDGSKDAIEGMGRCWKRVNSSSQGEALPSPAPGPGPDPTPSLSGSSSRPERRT